MFGETPSETNRFCRVKSSSSLFTLIISTLNLNSKSSMTRTRLLLSASVAFFPVIKDNYDNLSEVFTEVVAYSGISLELLSMFQAKIWMVILPVVGAKSVFFDSVPRGAWSSRVLPPKPCPLVITFLSKLSSKSGSLMTYRQRIQALASD